MFVGLSPFLPKIIGISQILPLGTKVNLLIIGESSFNMTRGNEDIEEGLQKLLDTGKGGSEKIVGLGRELRKCVYFKTNT